MTWRRARATAYRALGTLVLGLFSACNSPTLPTPPPLEPPQLDIPDAELRSDGEHVDVAGFALPGATVIVINRSLLDSNIDEASSVAVASLDDGKYQTSIRVDLRCSPKNVVDIFQRDSYGQFSKARTFDAPNGFEDGSTPPPTGGTGCTDAGSPDGGDAGSADDAATD
jgi:hypothetical protein